MIVAIESASTDPSVALATPDGQPIDLDAWSGTARQGAELLPRLLALAARSGRRLDGAAAVAVGIGPGSFTGLRVGMSLAKGLALALRLPIVGIPSLEAWLAADPDAEAAVGRAGARDAYVRARGSADTAIVDRDEIAARGFVAVVAPAELRTAFGLLDARPPTRAAAAVAHLAAERLALHPEGDDLHRLEPAYLRLPRGVRQVEETAIEWR